MRGRRHTAWVRYYCMSELAGVERWRTPSNPPAPSDAPSGGAPYTWDEPGFWKSKRFTDEGHRTLIQLWNCCQEPPADDWFTDPIDKTDRPTYSHPTDPPAKR